MKQEKKIPSILGLLLLLAGTFVGVSLSRSTHFFRPKATSDCRPINPQTTNITHDAFDISFTTTATCSSAVLVNDRTIPNTRKSSLTHYFHVYDLSPNQNYPFSVVSGGATWGQDEYHTQTASQPPGQIPLSNLAWGKVVNSDQSPAAGAIIYLIIPGASSLSSLVTSDGNWDISLATSFNQSKDDWFIPPENIEEEIIVISTDRQTTQYTGSTSANNPVPNIIIGQDSFVQQDTPSPPPAGFSPPPASASFSSDSQLQIHNPQDNESVFTSKPEFFGSAPSNTQIIITLHSPQEITDQTTADSQGNWSWSPSQDLSPGQHTITIKSKDPQTGLWQTISQRFTVYATEENSLAFSSSPSASPTTPAVGTPPKPSASIGATPSPTLTPAAAGTAVPVPTTRTAKPATDSGVPTSGFGIPTILTLSFAIMFIFLSYYLLAYKNRL